MKVEDIKKVELHLHLDGSVKPATLSKLKNISLEEAKDRLEAKDKCLDLNDYLTKFAEPNSIMQTKEGLEQVAYELALDLLKDNCIYAEIRFAPNKCNEILSLNEVIEAVLSGLRKTSLKSNLILCLMRDHSYDKNKEIIELAKRYLNNGVVGIDLAGAEAIYKTSDFEQLFIYAKELDIPFTIHAGEADGVNSIKSAIKFGAKRIGHGIRCIEDESCVDEIKNKDILLEICPTSNIQTNVVDEYKNHPIKELLDKGVKVCINTDNRTISKTSLNREYKELEKAFNFDKDDFYKMNVNAIKGAFISETEKEQLIKQLSN